MKRENALLWVLVALLLAAMAATLIWAPRRSRHGYGARGEVEAGECVARAPRGETATAEGRRLPGDGAGPARGQSAGRYMPRT